MIEIQSKPFVQSPDRDILVEASREMDQKNNATLSDDERLQVGHDEHRSCTQVGCDCAGIRFTWHRTVPSRRSHSHFQTLWIPDEGDKAVPAFSLIEAEGGLWKK